jgi:predicted metal-binding membrane protein
VTVAASRDRARLTTIAVVSSLASLAVIVASGEPVVDLAGYMAVWTPMMVAMMLPSAAPLMLLYRRSASAVATARLVVGYFAVWSAVGFGAWAFDRYGPTVSSVVILGVAGLYQVLPVKQACLRRCRTPADYLAQRWCASAFRLGVEHGLWCLRCCWALMAVAVLVGMMSLAWLVVIAALVAIEKLTPIGPRAAQMSGLVFIILAVAEGIT